MRCVTMVVIRCIKFWIIGVMLFGHPFEQLAPITDSGRRQFVAQAGNSIPKILVHPKRICGLYIVVEQVPCDFLAVADTILFPALFRRPSMWYNHSTIR